MKLCKTCRSECDRDCVTCPSCGEASWSATAIPEPMLVEYEFDPEPNEDLDA